MISNYVTTALRNIVKHKLYSAINIVGLAIGLASCVLILLFVRSELSYDDWIADSDRIHRLHSTFEIPGRSPFRTVRSSGPMKEGLGAAFPDAIESATRLLYLQPRIFHRDDVFLDIMTFVDPSFFDVFSLEFKAGDAATALPDTLSLMLSETAARKYFGSGPALGRTLTICCVGDETIDLRITAIFTDLPDNSHLSLDMIGLIDPSRFADMPWLLESWTSVNVFTYLKLAQGTSADDLEARLPDFLRDKVPFEPTDQMAVITDIYTLSLMNIRDIHLRAKFQASDGGDIRSLGDQASVYGFSALALLILIIACINFMNLTTARSTHRAREVSMRKVLGANRRQLMFQFLSEAVLISITALALALVMVELLLPWYNEYLGKQMVLAYFGGDGLLPQLIVVTVVTGLAGGLYPALYLSGFRPACLLNASPSSSHGGTGRVRTTLVITQFAISIGLIVTTAAVYAQTVYASNVDLGYRTDNMLILRGLGRSGARDSAETLRRELLELPAVTTAVYSSDVPTDNNENNSGFRAEGAPEGDRQIINYVALDHGFLEAYGVRPIAGRTFSEDFRTDAVSVPEDEEQPVTGAIILNAAAAKRLGFASPDEAIGRTVHSELVGRKMELGVIGVIPDIQFRSARYGARPSVFFKDDRFFDTLTLRFETDAIETFLADVEAIWKTHLPTVPFSYTLLDDLIAAQYEDEYEQAFMFAAFAILAVIISSLGLFGLASFTAERRTMEIGLRKVLGASVKDIVSLLVRQFTKPVLIANLIAWPVAGYLIADWLEGFEHRISFSPLIFLFVAAGALALIIAWATVAAHAIRVARANPIHALRYE